ncbi:hypothetical protein RFI_03933 [Reticulomyxa filosa]|uniref:Uncharacterized protein n=1 Tax=Reticulomyxa filosa TaxID=46433 RepID=X6P511_RETFI|nr:hypothetical protein RFI_03933 [Reticulomyxa filosa]|eukprot:ETO33174.1 hypothetical protein RFI_03933 [Reticulomyxa filosa]
MTIAVRATAIISDTPTETETETEMVMETQDETETEIALKNEATITNANNNNNNNILTSNADNNSNDNDNEKKPEKKESLETTTTKMSQEKKKPERILYQEDALKIFTQFETGTKNQNGIHLSRACEVYKVAWELAEENGRVLPSRVRNHFKQVLPSKKTRLQNKKNARPRRATSNGTKTNPSSPSPNSSPVPAPIPSPSPSPSPSPASTAISSRSAAPRKSTKEQIFSIGKHHHPHLHHHHHHHGYHASKHSNDNNVVDSNFFIRRNSARAHLIGSDLAQIKHQKELEKKKLFFFKKRNVLFINEAKEEKIAADVVESVISNSSPPTLQLKTETTIESEHATIDTNANANKSTADEIKVETTEDDVNGQDQSPNTQVVVTSPVRPRRMSKTEQQIADFEKMMSLDTNRTTEEDVDLSVHRRNEVLFVILIILLKQERKGRGEEESSFFIFLTHLRIRSMTENVPMLSDSLINGYIDSFDDREDSISVADREESMSTYGAHYPYTQADKDKVFVNNCDFLITKPKLNKDNNHSKQIYIYYFVRSTYYFSYCVYGIDIQKKCIKMKIIRHEMLLKKKIQPTAKKLIS